MKPKILFNAKDHPALNSGYSILSRGLLPHLGEHYGKENILIYAPIYTRDGSHEWQGMKVLPGKEWSYGENMILDHYLNYECNLLLQVGDTWPLGILPDLAAEDRILWIEWCAVDWIGMPKNIINRIKPAHKLVPFSKYGEAALRRAGLPNVEPAIWLGLDTELWRPLDRNNFPALMHSLGFSYDSFNILIVGANQERKRIRQQLEAISIFRKAYPQVKLRLYLHTHLVGDRDFRADIDELELEGFWAAPLPYIMEHGGITEEQMVKVFNCADVVLNVCIEGFGYSQLQAQACGVPVIVLSEGAGPELTVFGMVVPPINVETSSHQMTQPLPDVVRIAEALGEIWSRRQAAGGPMRSEAAVKFVQENFSWDKIATQWFGVIDQCMEDRIRYCMQIPDPALWLDEKAQHIVEIK